MCLEVNFSLEDDRSTSEARFRGQALWVEGTGYLVLHYPWGPEDLNLRFSLQEDKLLHVRWVWFLSQVRRGELLQIGRIQ